MTLHIIDLVVYVDVVLWGTHRQSYLPGYLVLAFGVANFHVQDTL